VERANHGDPALTLSRVSRGFRFNPPASRLSPETDWVLRSAFGASPAAGVAPADAAEAARRARRLSLGARIAGRLGRGRLIEELGPAAAPLLSDRTAAAAQGLSLDELLGDVAAVAAELDVPLVLLKGAALRAAGVTRSDTRFAADLDLLAPAADGARLRRALVGHGGREAGGRGYEQHLAPVLWPGRGVVELHCRVLGVRVSGGRRSADHRDLAEAGLLVPLPRLAGRCAVPRLEVLVAHCLAHGLAQHGLGPRGYAMAQVFADLEDLGFGSERGHILARSVAPWIAGCVSSEELGAALDLSRRLAAGDRAGLAGGASGEPASRLLDHLLAAALDDGYARSLRLRAFSRPVSDGGALAARLGALRAALAGVEGPAGRHQLELLARLGRYTADWWAVRGARRAGDG
jgi:hypothetical protein